MSKGIVIGKFYPPHLGHHYLIDTALKSKSEIEVLVVDSPAYRIPAEWRRAWLAERHPKANVQIIPDIGDDANSPVWAAHTIQFLGYTPDVVFTSEAYGKPWAEAMGCRYVDVDIPRLSIPISATKIREDMLASWDFLGDEVRAGLALRIVIVGAESTGSTTLARELSAKLRVPWVPEIGRHYTESILTTDAPWTDDDLYRIGKLQQAYENEMAKRSGGVIVCDTNAVATELWQRRYMGRTTAKMHHIAAHDKADLYIITGDEIPFEQDGLRDGEHIRHRMQNWFLKHIQATGVSFIVVTGDKDKRLMAALKASRDMIESKRSIPQPDEYTINTTLF